jgi:hypothetical protein
VPQNTEKVRPDRDLPNIYAFLRAQPGPGEVDSLLPPP